MSWTTERNAAERAARQAAAVLLERMGKVRVELKGPGDLVTEADRLAQQVIRKALAREFPGDDFLGEEAEPLAPDRTRPTQDAPRQRRWIVDPLDGTTNYVHRLGLYSVSIGLEVEGRMVVGVVWDPVRGECFSAAKGGGATCNGVPIQTSAAVRLDDALVCFGMAADFRRHAGSLEAMVAMTEAAQSVRRLGSTALSLAYVAAGRLDAFIGYGQHPWDIAAGAVIVEEAGGRVAGLDGASFNVYAGDLLASNGLLQGALLDKIGASQPPGKR